MRSGRILRSAVHEELRLKPRGREQDQKKKEINRQGTRPTASMSPEQSKIRGQGRGDEVKRKREVQMKEVCMYVLCIGGSCLVWTGMYYCIGIVTGRCAWRPNFDISSLLCSLFSTLFSSLFSALCSLLLFSHDYSCFYVDPLIVLLEHTGRSSFPVS